MFFLKELPSKAMVEKYTPHLTDDKRDSILEALQIMRQASVLVRNIETYFANNDLSQLRFLILVVIDREPDRRCLYAHEIASKLDVSRPVMTRALQRLVADKLLVSSTDKFDRRVREFTLTNQGKVCLRKILPGYFKQITELMTG